MEDNAGRRAALGKGAPREPSSARQDTIEEPEDALKSRHQGLPHHEVPLWSLNVKTKQTGSPQAQPAQGGLLPLPWTQGWCPTKSQRVDWMSPKAPKAKTLKPQGPGIEHRVPTSSSFPLASSCSCLGLLQKTPVRCQYLSSKWGDKQPGAPAPLEDKSPSWSEPQAPRVAGGRVSYPRDTIPTMLLCEQAHGSQLLLPWATTSGNQPHSDATYAHLNVSPGILLPNT